MFFLSLSLAHQKRPIEPPRNSRNGLVHLLVGCEGGGGGGGTCDGRTEGKGREWDHGVDGGAVGSPMTCERS